MAGAAFVAALRGDGPFLEDDDEFWRILEQLDEPVEVPDLFE
jgi:hypothetical protein